MAKKAQESGIQSRPNIRICKAATEFHFYDATNLGFIFKSEQKITKCNVNYKYATHI